MAQFIPQVKIEEIRQKANIVDVVGQYVQLKKSGKSYMGLCPFHGEKSPSFSVSSDRQVYHCFGCGKGGNVFGFVQDIEGITFPEAVLKVSEFTDVDVTDISVATKEKSPLQLRNEQLIKLHEEACDIYHHLLMNTQIGEPALEYLKQRGMSEEQLLTFKIGFAPNQNGLLKKVFENQDNAEELMMASGLFVESGENLLDRFQNRIMFPVRNEQGKVIAFSGRLMPKQAEKVKQSLPKYLNSPETDIFNKRKVLFNYDLAKPNVRKVGQIVLFEGFMDVIASWSAGVMNGVASMGTSLTSEQIQMLQKVSDEVVICYDGDNAGVEAANRAIDILQEQRQKSIKVISLPEGIDPDDYIKTKGTDSFQELYNHGQLSVFQFRTSYLKRSKNLQNEQEKVEYIEEVLQELAKVPSIIEREVYARQLSLDVNVSLDVITEQLKKLRESRRIVERQNYSPPTDEDFPPPIPDEPYNQEIVIPQYQQVKKVTKVEKAEQMLIYRLLNSRSLRDQLRGINDFCFAHEEYQELYYLLEGYLIEHGEFNEADFYSIIKTEETGKLLSRILQIGLTGDGSDEEVRDYLRVIQNASLEEKLSTKRTAQIEATRMGNKELEATLAIEIIDIIRQLKSV